MHPFQLFSSWSSKARRSIVIRYIVPRYSEVRYNISQCDIYAKFFYILRNHDEARDKYNQIKEEIMKKVGSENRAGYVQMKEEDYRDFFEGIIEKAKQ